MPAPKDLAGMKFGRLTAVRVSSTKPVSWECACECGNTAKVQSNNLSNGHTLSCGCLVREKTRDRSITHGATAGGNRERLFRVWVGMRQRCYTATNKAFPKYGGRGIVICDEWLSDYSAFRRWAHSHGYADNLSIERIDVNGNYEPSNCCWNPIEMQPFNQTQRKVIIRSDGAIFISMSFASRATGVSISGISKVLSGKQASASGWGWRYAEDWEVPVVEPCLVANAHVSQPANEQYP